MPLKETDQGRVPLRCPKCRCNFVQRRAGGCPNCYVRIVKPGEFIGPTEVVYLLKSDGTFALTSRLLPARGISRAPSSQTP